MLTESSRCILPTGCLQSVNILLHLRRSPAPPSEFGTCLGDLYSVAWMENADENDLTLGAAEFAPRALRWQWS